MRRWLQMAALLALGASAEAGEVVWGGQVRPRFEFRDPASAGDEAFTSMRVRAHMKARLQGGIGAFIQVQDVRLWGEEAHTLGDFSADNFDLHQGYISIENMAGAHQLRLGRQAISLGGERLVGAVEWTQQGRVFDGLRLMLKPAWGTIDVLAIQLAEAAAAPFDDNAYLLGAYATWEGLDLYGLYDRGAATERLTAGLRLLGRRASYTYRLEGAWQAGERAGLDVAAFMLGARLGRPVGRAKLVLWYDYLSGDDDPADGESQVFDTLFATNHKFYGFADLFLNIPVHTKGLGLQDIALKVALPLDERLNLAVHGHSFRTARQGALESAHLAEELDLTLSCAYRPGLSWVSGLSYVWADDALLAVRGIGEDVVFLYTMASVTF